MFRVLTFLLFGLVLAPSLRAQTTANGSIRGIATDQQGAVLPGVEVTATSPAVPGVYAATTDANGHYRLGDLPPGDYTIVAVLEGFSKFARTPVTIRAGLNLDVNIVMEVGSIEETVEVRQDTPLLETRNAVQAVNISGELLRSMPLSERREWFGALTLAPGVATAESASNVKLFYVHGADSDTNVVQIDGADVGSTLLSAVEYLGLNTDSVGDIQLKTTGVDASSPLGVGGVINIAAASGTNDVRGAATLFIQPRSWNGSNTPDGTSSTVDQKQADVSIGGPLTKNRVWGFGAYRYVNVSNGVSRTREQIDALRSLAPGFTPHGNTNRADFWFLKLNTRLSAAHHLDGFYQYDVNPVTTFTSAVIENPRSQATGGSGASVRLSSIWSDKLTTRLGVNYNDKHREVRPPDVGGPIRRVYEDTILSAGRLLGNGRIADLGAPISSWTEQLSSKLTLFFDTTWFTAHALGSHELQAGIYAQPRLESGLRRFWVNGGFAYEEAVLHTDGTVQPFHRLVVDGTEVTSADLRGSDYAFYIQDAWRPTARLTINAGLRVDRVAWTDRLFDVRTLRTSEVGPRFGLNYALTADFKNIVRAHWVRVHDQPSQTATSVGTASLAQSDFFDLDVDGRFETVFETPATFTVTPNRTIDPGLHQPFVQDWGLGYDRQLAGNVTARVDFLHRRFRDRRTFVETNAAYAGNRFIGYADEDFNELYRITNNEWNTPVYSSLALSVTKRTTAFEAIVSYVRQWRHLDGTWLPNDPAAFIQPGAFPNDKGIGASTDSSGIPFIAANSLSGHSMAQRTTTSAQWQDHIVRLGATYAGPWKLLVAGSYTFQSGAWSGPLISRVEAPDPAFGPETVTLSNGRVVSNPLATTLRFAFPTRGDNQLRTPRFQMLNLRLGRRFEVRGLTIAAALDLFNVTNNGADLSFQFGANQTFNPLFGLTEFRQLPRSAQITLRISL